MNTKYGLLGLILGLIFSLYGCGNVTKNTDSTALESDYSSEALDQSNTGAITLVPKNATINAYGELPLLTYNTQSFFIKTSPTDPLTTYALVGLQSFSGNPDPLLNINKIITGTRNDKYGYNNLLYFSLLNGDIYSQAKGPAGVMTTKLSKGLEYANALASISTTLRTVRNGNYFFHANPELSPVCTYIELMKNWTGVYGGKQLIMYNNSVFSGRINPEDQKTYYTLIGNQKFGPNPLNIATHNQIVAGWKSFKFDEWDLYFFNLDNGTIYRQKGLHASELEKYSINSPQYFAALSWMSAYMKIVRDQHLYMGVLYSPANPYVAQSQIYISKMIPVAVPY